MDLDKLITELYGSYSRNAHFVDSGKIAYYRYEGDTLSSFITPEAFITKCKKWIVSHKGYSVICGMSADKEWFEICKDSIPQKTITEQRQYWAAAEAVIWMMDSLKD